MSWFPLWIPSPLEGYDPTLKVTPNVEHLPIKTRKGRVIYNRKPHKWTKKDVLRVSREYFGIQKSEKSSSWLMQLLEQLTIMMMDEILETATGEEWDKELVAELYFNIRDTLAKLISKLPQELITTLENNPIYPYIP